jgi:hypothetical protein
VPLSHRAGNSHHRESLEDLGPPTGEGSGNGSEHTHGFGLRTPLWLGAGLALLGF